jgi:hypothetical protein
LMAYNRSDVSDANIQRKLTSTWVVDMTHDVRGTNIIHSDGHFEAQVSGIPDCANITTEGTLFAKNGILIETVTKFSPTNTSVPFVLHGHIIRLDDNELVVNWDNVPNRTVTTSRKVER